MKLSLLSTAGLAAASAITNPLSRRQEEPDTWLEITKIVPSGTACPPETYTIDISEQDPMVPNLSVFTLGFDRALFGSDSRALLASSKCTVVVSVRYPGPGCPSATWQMTTEGYYGAYGGAFATVNRRYHGTSDPLSATDAGMAMFAGGGDEFIKSSLFTLQDTVLDQPKLARNSKMDQTMTIELELGAFAEDRTGMDETFMSVQSFTTRIRLDSYDPDCQ